MWHSRLRGLLQDRLVWFILAGIALFVGEWGLQQRNARLIIIDLPLVQKLVVQWQAQMQTPPTAEQLDALIEGHIREEILVREAARLGLDKDDVIIRRRLAQKVEFFLSDNNVPAMPDESTLRAFFNQHKTHYAIPPNLSFRHIFATSEAQGAQILNMLQNKEQQSAADWRSLGAPFMLQREYGDVAHKELADLFGSDFADALFVAQNRRDWFGLVRSAYGWHVVQIVGHRPKQSPDFEAVAARVARDWQDNEMRVRRQAAWAELRAQYHIQMMPIEDAP